MQDKERWDELCKKASVEQDPAKLLDLIEEIDRLMEEKQQRLDALGKNAAKHGES